jgi:hypothetical protein
VDPPADADAAPAAPHNAVPAPAADTASALPAKRARDGEEASAALWRSFPITADHRHHPRHPGTETTLHGAGAVSAAPTAPRLPDRAAPFLPACPAPLRLAFPMFRMDAFPGFTSDIGSSIRFMESSIRVLPGFTGDTASAPPAAAASAADAASALFAATAFPTGIPPSPTGPASLRLAFPMTRMDDVPGVGVAAPSPAAIAPSASVVVPAARLAVAEGGTGAGPGAAGLFCGGAESAGGSMSPGAVGLQFPAGHGLPACGGGGGGGGGGDEGSGGGGGGGGGGEWAWEAAEGPGPVELWRG